MKYFLIVMLCAISIFAQTEILTNAEVIEMSNIGLGKPLILQKISLSNAKFDVTVKGLVELKKANIDDGIIELMIEKSKIQPEISREIPTNQIAQTPVRTTKTLTPKELLSAAKTVVISKNSVFPSLQSLEKELMKRSEWQHINVAITEDKVNADLSVQISFVHLSLITHRYTYRIFDRRTGLLIAGGETTSWGSLSKNLAKSIVQSLDKVLNQPN